MTYQRNETPEPLASDRVSQIEVTHRWQLLIAGIKEYASDYALLCRNAALEEAAKVCENSHPPLTREGGRVEIGERARNAFADAIRNLKENGNG